MPASILAACESLAQQGFPRPAARALGSLDDLRRISRPRGSAPNGECDEGVGYWFYGMGFACIGWSRLATDELAREPDMNRLRQIAHYLRSGTPVRRHLLQWQRREPQRDRPAVLHPLAGQCDRRRVPQALARRAHPWNLRSFSVLARTIDAIVSEPGVLSRPALASSSVPARSLDDQQTAIFSTTATNGRRVVACLSGGSNAERHNHNDLGHFLIAVDERVLVPDLGAPVLHERFLRQQTLHVPQRSSRGHCCPIIDGQEQRAGSDTAGNGTRLRPSQPSLRIGPVARLSTGRRTEAMDTCLTLDAPRRGSFE